MPVSRPGTSVISDIILSWLLANFVLYLLHLHRNLLYARLLSSAFIRVNSRGAALSYRPPVRGLGSRTTGQARTDRSNVFWYNTLNLLDQRIAQLGQRADLVRQVWVRSTYKSVTYCCLKAHRDILWVGLGVSAPFSTATSRVHSSPNATTNIIRRKKAANTYIVCCRNPTTYIYVLCSLSLECDSILSPEMPNTSPDKVVLLNVFAA